MPEKMELSAEQRDDLLRALKARFEKNMARHEGLAWSDVQARLDTSPVRLWSLSEMERTGGEPDVVGRDGATGEVLFCDCSAESPKGRRSICYDPAGLAEREKEGLHPGGSAVGLAEAMGVELLTEEQYRALQTLGAFDTKTSSWVKTPAEIRKLGGGIFMDRRYNTVFLYHNGASSFYAARGFRGMLRA